MNNKAIRILGAFFLVLLAFTGGYLVRDNDVFPSPQQRNDDFVLGTDQALYEVMEELLDNHVSQPEREDLIFGAIEGMIATLDDPYTSYFDLEEAEAYSLGFSETYVGIGVTVVYKQNLIVVEDIVREGPAYDVGLRINDVITHVDGQEVFDLSFYETIGMILGEEGTEVVIGVYRNGYEETLFFPITRQVIYNSSVEFEMIEEAGENIGYIKVTQFGDETYAKFHNAVVSLENLGMDRLVVDLRDNGGGHLLTVYYMLNEFLIDDGVPMFSTEYYSEGVLRTNNYYATNTERKSYPIVTLINENSASASEVFASSMSEHGGYPLVGTTSFGKGTMQVDRLISATVGDQLHITIGKWITSDGNWVHYDGGSDGITPDLVVEKTAVETAYKVFLLDGEPIVYDTVDDRTANIQLILNMMGYDLRTDGYFDTETRDAVLDVQLNNSLVLTGDLDEDTLYILNNVLHEFIFDHTNDTQLQAAITYVMEQND
jgi:carboxyl-terminal processing protease